MVSSRKASLDHIYPIAAYFWFWRCLFRILNKRRSTVSNTSHTSTLRHSTSEHLELGKRRTGSFPGCARVSPACSSLPPPALLSVAPPAVRDRHSPPAQPAPAAPLLLFNAHIHTMADGDPNNDRRSGTATRSGDNSDSPLQVSWCRRNAPWGFVSL